MPAEWEPHDATWLAWPHDPETFPDLPGAGEACLAIISALAPAERVNLLVRDREMESEVTGLFRRAGIDPGRVTLVPFDYADVWIRDYGPAFVVNRPTRPSVSISFCRPVKIGWQFAQISRCSSGFVDRVFHVAPQAHRTSTSWYFGWMASFTVAPRSSNGGSSGR